MNKKILAIMIAAALLQGCASYRQLESTRKEAVAEQQRAREMMSDLRTRTPVVKESSRQWINPRPVMDKNTGKTVPGCPIVIHTRQSITLQQVVQRITAYSALFDHGLASKSDQRFASIRSTGNLTFSTAF